MVKRVFQEYATGTFTLGELATKAKQWGLTSPHTKKPLSMASIAKILQNPFYMGQMLVNGTLYPHVYPVLIEPDLFLQCQKVRMASSSKGGNKPEERKQQRAKKPFIFRGMMRCKECGCQICSDIKKDQYIYLFCTKAKGKDKCNSARIREEVALEAVERVLEQIKVPDDLIKKIHARLKSQYDLERSTLRNTKQRLQSQFEEADARLERLMTLFVNGSITQDIYDKKRLQLDAEREGLAQQLVDYSKDDSEFRDSFITLLRVVSKAAETFKSSKVEQKRKILSFVFSNLWLEGKKVGYELNRPFDKLIALGDSKVWWSIGDSNS
jgi:site-specific DNA recombinase